MKTPVPLACSLMAIFFLVAIPCEAGGKHHRDGGHRGGNEHHHHHHGYRWFGVIPRPQWVPYSGYYAVPQYYAVPPPNVIGAPAVTEVPQDAPEVILVPQGPQSFEDYQKSIRIPIPSEGFTTELTIPQPPPRKVAPRRIDHSKAATVEKYVVGEVACPLDLPKGGIVRMCNAHSGKYKLPGQGDGKYFHQQECWFCENILGGN